MANDQVQTERVAQVVFSVCASKEVAATALEACDKTTNATFEGEFQDYFTGDRRPQFSAAIKSADDCVALVDCDRDREQAITTMERLRTMRIPHLSVVGYATEIQSDYLLRAMRAGCNEFLKKPAEMETLRDALVRFQNVQIAGATTQKSKGRVMSLFGVKGGVGTTTLAVHLANSLVRRHRKRTLLVDHHSELGHVALYLGMKDGQYHFDELVRNADRLDADLLNGFISRHPSGLDVLASPECCAAEQQTSPQEMELVLSFLRTQYDYVLIDSSITSKSMMPSLVHASDEVCLISSPDVAALRDLARRIEHISLTEQVTGKLRIVINRSTSEDAVNAEQIEAAVRYPVWIAIPNNYAELIRAINGGEPVPSQSRSNFAQQINRWADQLLLLTATPIEQEKKQKARFSFWPTLVRKPA